MRTFILLACAATCAAGPPVLAQEVASAAPDQRASDLPAFLAEAARENAVIPERLKSYRATVETEMGLALLDSAGRERTVQLEQIASGVRWLAPDRYDQRVIGYRTQAIGPTFSLMTMFGGWTTPTLYGNRLQLGVLPASAINKPTRGQRAGLTVHPLGDARDTYYAFDGGDTVVVLFSRGRRIPVVSVRVIPRADAPGDAILFSGELHIDADRKQIVRMRGRMVDVRGGRQTISSGSRFPGASGAAFVELVNVEVDGRYWLPAYQRTELHARFALIGPSRVIVRIVSRFDSYRLNDSSWMAVPDASAPGHYLTFAPKDSLTRFAAWSAPIGKESAEAEYADFDDVSPAAWRADGTGRVRFRPETMGQVLRFNRIEGAFTGVALASELGSDATDARLSVRGSLGWAWAEATPRGMLGADRATGDWTTGVRLQRTLAHTNDFRLPLSTGATFSALFGSIDDFDYLDRRSASLLVTRVLRARSKSLVRFELGAVSDKAVEAHVSRGLFVDGAGFRPNRGIWEGNYVKSAASIEINPQVSGVFVDRGVGAQLHYERADGDVNWQRLELRAAARREVGPLEVYARADGGTLLASAAPQALFELGGIEGLSGYGYKEFAGDRAAMLRTAVGYNFPVLRAPIRFAGGIFAPGLAPGISAGIHGGWTEISSVSGERALLGLGSQADSMGLAVPVSRPTDGIRGSAELALTFFSGALSVGMARPIDHAAPWRFTMRIGQGF